MTNAVSGAFPGRFQTGQRNAILWAPNLYCAPAVASLLLLVCTVTLALAEGCCLFKATMELGRRE